MEEAQEKRRARYAEPVAKSQRNRWKACCEPTEVSNSGLFGTVSKLGPGTPTDLQTPDRRAVKNILEAAAFASSWL